MWTTSKPKAQCLYEEHYLVQRSYEKQNRINYVKNDNNDYALKQIITRADSDDYKDEIFKKANHNDKQNDNKDSFEAKNDNSNKNDAE